MKTRASTIRRSKPDEYSTYDSYKSLWEYIREEAPPLPSTDTDIHQLERLLEWGLEGKRPIVERLNRRKGGEERVRVYDPGDLESFFEQFEKDEDDGSGRKGRQRRALAFDIIGLEDCRGSDGRYNRLAHASEPQAVVATPDKRLSDMAEDLGIVPTLRVTLNVKTRCVTQDWLYPQWLVAKARPQRWFAQEEGTQPGRRQPKEGHRCPE